MGSATETPHYLSVVIRSLAHEGSLDPEVFKLFREAYRAWFCEEECEEGILEEFKARAMKVINDHYDEVSDCAETGIAPSRIIFEQRWMYDAFQEMCEESGANEIFDRVFEIIEASQAQELNVNTGFNPCNDLIVRLDSTMEDYLVQRFDEDPSESNESRLVRWRIMSALKKLDSI